MLEFRSIIFFLGLLLLSSLFEKVLSFALIFSSIHLDDFSSWRIVVIHDSWKDHSNLLKTVFLNYLFVLLFSILYSVFNEHLLLDTT